MWGAMRFLLEAYRRQRRRLRLEQLLLLAARCLLIALIAVGLGRPLLQRAGLLGSGSVTLYVLIDNSIASGATDDDGATALERHQEAGAHLLGRLDPSRGDRAGLIALGGPAEPIVMPSSAEIEGVSRAMSSLESTASAMDLDGALSRLAGELAERDSDSGPVRIVVLSDFLAGSANTERTLTTLNALNDLAMLATAPAPVGVRNVGVTGLEPLRPVLLAGDELDVRQEQVRVLLRRSGPGVGEAGITNIRISQERPGEEGGSAVVGEGTVRWSRGETTADVPVPVSVVGAGEAGVLVATIDHDSIQADDTFRRPIDVRSRLHVGIVARRRLGVGADRVPFDAADLLGMALSPQGAEGEREISVTRIEPGAMDTGRLAGLDAVILIEPNVLDAQGWSRMSRFAPDGGLVLVFPPAESTTHPWTDDMLTAFGLDWTIGRETVEHDEPLSFAVERGPFDAGEDLLHLLSGELEELTRRITINRSLPLRAAADQGTSLLMLDDGSTFMMSAAPRGQAEDDERIVQADRGLVVFFSVAPSFDWTDLPARPFIVPLMQEVVRQGLGLARGANWGIAGRPITTPARTSVIESLEEGRNRRVEVSIEGVTSEPIRRTGLWRARDGRGIDRGLVGVNADTSGSLGDAQSPGEISAWLARATPQTGVTWLEGATEDVQGQSVGTFASLGQRDASSGLAAKILMAALAVGLLELAMAKLFSHARQEAPA
jgi:hypothetical protein